GYIPLFFKGVRNNALAEFIQYRAAKNKGWNADNDTVSQYQYHLIPLSPGYNSQAGVRRQKTLHDHKNTKENDTTKKRQKKFYRKKKGKKKKKKKKKKRKKK
ncbi:hypothetical protein, partial [Escherichia coli]|uniref:hypothetical protein n=1 Tax=Escherichia coli TaxID=562 RepID=UPI0035D507BC